MSTVAQYYIHAGVRRCVAARDAGLKDIPAQIVEAGKPDVFVRLSLAQLHSPKRVVLRDHRYIRNTEYPTRVLKSDPPPIVVEPLGLPHQTSSVPLSQVILR
jgi:hypothetical protein